MAQPQHLRPEWNACFSRLQGTAARQNGYAILSVEILIGPNGNPVWYTEPSLRKIEPIAGSTQWFGQFIGKQE
jgi:hypothetical protein